MRWQTQPIEWFCSTVASGGTPSTKRDEFYGGNIPWLRTQEVKFGQIWDTKIKITEAALEGSAAKWIPEDSVIVAMYGASAGRVAINKIPLTTNQACCNLIAATDRADYRYLYYAILSRFSALESLAKGAAQRNLNAGQIKSFRIPAPSLPEQHRIAAILSAYDDLIENNQRRIQLLEQAARLLYKEWFVHLRFPGHENVPIIEGVPEGWKKEALGELTSVITKGTTPTTLGRSFVEKGVNFLKVESIDSAGHLVRDKLARVDWETHELLGRSKLQEGDILFSIAGAIGRTAIVPDWVVPANTNQAIAIIRPLEPGLKHYQYWAIRSDEFKAFSLGRVVQTAQANVSLTALKSALIVLPSPRVLRRFVETVAPMHAQIDRLDLQIHKASQARDLLLPRLMNGEIPV